MSTLKNKRNLLLIEIDILRACIKNLNNRSSAYLSQCPTHMDSNQRTIFLYKTIDKIEEDIFRKQLELDVISATLQKCEDAIDFEE